MFPRFFKYATLPLCGYIMFRSQQSFNLSEKLKWETPGILKGFRKNDKGNCNGQFKALPFFFVLFGL